MTRLTMVYAGKEADKLNKWELMSAILQEYKIEETIEMNVAMGEAFRCGFLQGEEFAYGYKG